jgi:hypothetical protein
MKLKFFAALQHQPKQNSCVTLAIRSSFALNLDVDGDEAGCLSVLYKI